MKARQGAEPPEGKGIWPRPGKGYAPGGRANQGQTHRRCTQVDRDEHHAKPRGSLSVHPLPGTRWQGQVTENQKTAKDQHK